MKKTLLAVLIAVILAGGGYAVWESKEDVNNNSQEDLETTIVISQDTVDFEEGESLMEVMEKNFELTLDNSGEFIVGIDGVESDTDKSYFWTYTVNEEEVMVGAKEYFLKKDDVVKFKYAKWE